MKNLFFGLVLLFFSLLSLSAGSTEAQGPYLSGIQAFQEGELEKAREFFKSAWELEPGNTRILYNWGLTEEKLGQTGLSAALWRRALFLDPDFSMAREALNFITPRLAPQPPANGWESFRSGVLLGLSFGKLLAILGLCLIASGTLLLTYFGRRRAALKDENPLPPTPFYGIFLSLLTIFSLGLLLSKTFDYYSPRGTLVQEKVQIRSAPTDQAPGLFEVSAGIEVLLRATNSNWVQVKYPGGMTGWVQKSEVFQTSGRALW